MFVCRFVKLADNVNEQTTLWNILIYKHDHRRRDYFGFYKYWIVIISSSVCILRRSFSTDKKENQKSFLCYKTISNLLFHR